MPQQPISKRVLAALVGTALVLTATLAVVLVTGHVLGKMGDPTGQAILDRIALGIGIIWTVDVVCLVLAMGVNALTDDQAPPDDPT